MKLASLFISALFFAACGSAPNVNPSNSNIVSHQNQVLTVVERPQKIKDMMTARGEQDEAAPTLKIVEPRAGVTIESSTVKVKIELSGDLKGYMPHMDEATKTGNHIHVILDNQPYEAYYNIDQPFELRNVADGEHTLRVFPSRPWHEAYKNEGAFQMVKFTVKNGGADTSKPTMTNTGNTMANPGGNASVSERANASASPTPEGKDMQNSKAGVVDPTKPLLTFSRPKGEYKGADADAIMIDFWLTNAKLKDDGGNYGIRYSVDGFKSTFINKWQPIWLTGWPAGKYTIKLELTDHEGNLVDNGGYNSTTREITITK